MLLSQAESARAIFLRSLQVDDIIRVPTHKGLGRIIALNNRIHVQMLNGPFYDLFIIIKWEDAWDISG